MGVEEEGQGRTRSRVSREEWKGSSICSDFLCSSAQEEAAGGPSWGACNKGMSLVCAGCGGRRCCTVKESSGAHLRWHAAGT